MHLLLQLKNVARDLITLPSLEGFLHQCRPITGDLSFLELHSIVFQLTMDEMAIIS